MPLFLKNGPGNQLKILQQDWTSSDPFWRKKHPQATFHGKPSSFSKGIQKGQGGGTQPREQPGKMPPSPSAPVITGHPSTSSLGKASGCLGTKSKKWHIQKEPSLGGSSQQLRPPHATATSPHLSSPIQKATRTLSWSCYEVTHIIKPSVGSFPASCS